MSVVEAPPVTQSAVLLDGYATAVFGSRPYPRVIRSVVMRNTTTGRVSIYRGVSGGAFALVSSHPQGSDQQYTVPFKLPAGQSLFVRWDSAPTPVSAAFAVITWMEGK